MCGSLTRHEYYQKAGIDALNISYILVENLFKVIFQQFVAHCWGIKIQVLADRFPQVLVGGLLWKWAPWFQRFLSTQRLTITFRKSSLYKYSFA
jgi:hypothetical protein